MTEKLRVDRKDLARILGNDPRLIKAFEDIFRIVEEDTNSNPIAVQALNILVNSASYNAAQALSSIDSLSQSVSNQLALNNQSQFLSLLESLKRIVELQSIRYQSENRQPIVDYIDFSLNPPHTNDVARLTWNETDDTLNIHHSGDVTQQVGEEIYARVTNNTGVTITNGQFIGLTGSGTSVTPYIANASVPPLYAIGVATQDIPNGGRGRLTVWGRVRELDTSAWVAGTIVYASPTIAGALTNVKPTAPNLVIPVGVVTNQSATLGEIFVRPVIEQQLYYGAFVRTTDVTPAVANTAYAITFDTTSVSNGVTIGTPASRIVVSNSGLYTFSVSFQLTSTNSSIKNVYLWFRKNGVDVPNSTIIRSLESGTAVGVQTRSMFFSLAANDYIEVMWASDDVNVLLDARAATAFAPSAPAVLLTVDQIQQ